MGCGKSSVGRRLSQLLCCPFIDLDDVIEKRTGRTIAEIFAAEGEAGFREIELESLLTVVEGGCSKTESLPRLRRGPLPFTRPRAATVFDSSPLHNAHLVLSLGGGTIMTPQCAELVHSQTLCIYLRASVDTLMERLSEEISGRPLLAAHHDNLRSHITEVLSKRACTYDKNAHIIIDTDAKSIETIASEIISKFN